MGIEFDPGFEPYIIPFRMNIELFYNEINKFKNFSQRKIKFKQYYKKILDGFYNNLGFYIGCLMWAAYTKTVEKQELLNNYCFGEEYNENDNPGDIDFMIKFTELFPKDMKYFLGENFEFENYVINILKTYREFLVMNKGFVDSKTNLDIQIPKNINIEDAETYKDKIYEILKTGELSKLLSYKELCNN